MSEKPNTGYTAMQEEPDAGGPPPYGMEPGYPMAQLGCSQPVMAQPMMQLQTSTTVVVTQPSQVVLPKEMRDWNTGLFGCFKDSNSCWMGALCGPCLLCSISSRMGEDCCFLTFIGARQVGLGAMCWLAPWLYYPGTLVALRIKLRVQENIQGSLCNDYCVAQFCGPCALCQLHRELNHIGLWR